MGNGRIWCSLIFSTCLTACNLFFDMFCDAGVKILLAYLLQHFGNSRGVYGLCRVKTQVIPATIVEGVIPDDILLVLFRRIIAL